jgi:predicted esterase
MSLYFALNYGQPIKGVCAFGGYMFRTSQYLNLSTVSFLLLHGKEDKILLEEECKKTYSRILK